MRNILHSSVRKKSRRTGIVERKHQCNICSKAFQKRSQIERHMRVHSGEKPFIVSLLLFFCFVLFLINLLFIYVFSVKCVTEGLVKKVRCKFTCHGTLVSSRTNVRCAKRSLVKKVGKSFF